MYSNERALELQSIGTINITYSRIFDIFSMLFESKNQIIYFAFKIISHLITIKILKFDPLPIFITRLIKIENCFV